MADFSFHRALAGIWEFVSAVNRYIDAAQPWALAKDEQRAGQLNRVLATLADSLRFLGIVLEPFLPESAEKIRRTVGDSRKPELRNAVVGRINTIPDVSKLGGLFPRVVATADAVSVKETVAVQIAAPRITIDDFGKVELRVAEVLAAEPLPKSKKLLKLTVSLGAERRTLVAGIAEHYAPADLVGKKVVVVANLEPAKLMGVESNGMVLAGSADGKLAVLTLDRDLPPGAKVR